MTDNYERCSCGARYKSKCVKESVFGSGKMCVRVLLDKIDSGEAWLTPDVRTPQQEATTREWTITTLDANTAFEMIENPPEANEKLIELLRLE